MNGSSRALAGSAENFAPLAGPRKFCAAPRETELASTLCTLYRGVKRFERFIAIGFRVRCVSGATITQERHRKHHVVSS